MNTSIHAFHPHPSSLPPSIHPSILLPGAGFLNLPLSQFPTWRAQVLSGELLDKSKKTVVICHHGGRSMQVASFLTSQAGFESVFNLSGGINMYSQLVDDSIPMY